MALLQEGETIRDTYEVERLLGEGAFAEVYRVKHRFLGRQAMKVFKPVGMSLGEVREMLSEASLLSQLGHANIVRVFDANVLETPGGLRGYFTMEHVATGSLEKFRRSHLPGLIPLEKAVDLICQVCRGLAVAHRAHPPIVHGDIKPQNILVGHEGPELRVRISDFGLAKKVNALTLLATSAGTLAFKPPEAFSDLHGDSCPADVWAVGCTLYILLTDRLPYDVPAYTGWDTRAVFDQPMLSPSEVNPDVDRELDDIVARSLARNPAERYPDARAMLGALEAWRERRALPPGNGVAARELVERALRLRQDGSLRDAADLMEAAFEKEPGLRQKYAPQVRLWRCGISM